MPRSPTIPFGLHRYGPLLRIPDAPRLLFGTFLCRTGNYGASLGVLLAVHAATGSFGIAGTASGMLAAGLAIGRLAQGRLIDRKGPTQVLLTSTLLFLAAMAGLVAATSTRAGAAIVLPLSALVGGTLPGIDMVARMLWATLTPAREERARAYALDQMTLELSAILGAAITGVVATTVSPAFALVALAVLTSGGAILTAGCAVARTTPPRPRGRRGGLARPLALPVAVMVGLGLMVGCVNVAVPAFAAYHHAAGATGPLFAAWGLGSIVGGLWYGARVWGMRLETRLVISLALLTLGSATLPLAGSVTVLGALLLLSTLPAVPAITTVYLLTDRVSPERLGEMFAWLSSGVPTGLAVGATLAGWTVAASGPRAAFALATALSLLALLAGVAAARGSRRSQLTPA